MPTLLLVGFVLYLYIPYLIFRFAAEVHVDFDRRKDAGQIEEFFYAALPSAALNVLALAILVAAGALSQLLRCLPHGAALAFWFPFIDWKIVASIFEEKLSTFQNHIAAGPWYEVAYVLTLYVVAAWQGSVFGEIAADKIALGVSEEEATSITEDRSSYWKSKRWMHDAWERFFTENLVWISHWAARPTWLFVRTEGDRLFYGMVLGYNRDRSGELDGLVMFRAQRYSRTNVEEALKAGRNPLTRLHGSLYIKWSQIKDINIVEDEVMRRLRRRYAKRILEVRVRERSRRRIRKSFAKLIR